MEDDWPLAQETLTELSHESRQRLLIQILAEENRELTLRDLTIKIVDRENNEPITDVSSEEVVEATLEIEHTHLPTLEETGLISFDEDRKIVTPSDDIERIVEHFDEFEDS